MRRIPELIVAIEIDLPFLAAKQRCPISCSIKMNKRGIKSQAVHGTCENSNESVDNCLTVCTFEKSAKNKCDRNNY